jgi:hypothetical protein
MQFSFVAETGLILKWLLLLLLAPAFKAVRHTS